MIKIKRNEIPSILQENQQVWTNELYYLINEYGNYKNIPKKEKNKAVNQYRHRSIAEAVISLTNGKCVFCESYIENVDYTNIEHFYPKSLYPKFTFKWSNLFPACRKCNIKKGDNDTKNQYPIVHPENDDPEEYFIYKNLK
ncbi:retron system putative HNH endonuclease, partial [Desulfobacterales bacterium HSG2]|nr:retron system putative HNH endonuclease [Desulfobacterales bacterium HSG2]